LHDDVVQSLIHILQLGRFLRGETESGSQAFRDATELAELTEETLTELRHVVGDLRYSPLGRGGLIPTLQGLARDLRFDWRTKITVMVPDEVKLMPEQQVALYQLLKEAMLNALKHAHADEIRVSIESRDGTVVGTVIDNGHGFDPQEVDYRSHFGLGLMKERSRIVGANLEVQSTVDQGTEVSVAFSEEENYQL